MSDVSVPIVVAVAVEHVPPVPVTPSITVPPVFVQTLFAATGPLAVVIAWLKVITIVSPWSNRPAVPPFATATDWATTPSRTATVGFPVWLDQVP